MLAWRVTHAFARSGLAVVVVLLGAIPMTSLHASMQEHIPQPLAKLYFGAAPLRVTSSYGLFRRMTGVGSTPGELEWAASSSTWDYDPVAIVARPEVVLEGLDSTTQEWIEIEFLYKPGDVTAPPKYAAPHQPRLDWQMWFAALGSYQTSPWLVHLVARLLDDCPAAVMLLDQNKYPFPPGHPPEKIRAKLYHYDFTRMRLPWTERLLGAAATHDSIAAAEAIASNDGSPSAWWGRRYASEYLPAVRQNDPSVRAYLRHHNLLPSPLVNSTCSPAQHARSVFSFATTKHKICRGSGRACAPLAVWALHARFLVHAAMLSPLWPVLQFCALLLLGAVLLAQAKAANRTAKPPARP